MLLLLPPSALFTVVVVLGTTTAVFFSSATNTTIEKVDSFIPSINITISSNSNGSVMNNATHTSDILNARKMTAMHYNKYIVSADEVSPRTQYLIRTIVKPAENDMNNNNKYSPQQQNAYEDKNNDNNDYNSSPPEDDSKPYAPSSPPSPPSYSKKKNDNYAPYSSETLYETPKPSSKYCSYGDVSIGSLGCMPRAKKPNDKCQLDAQCTQLGEYVECRNGKCQCESGFASIITMTMSSTTSNNDDQYDNPYATPSPYQKPPEPIITITCVPKLRFLAPNLICNIEQPCCVQPGQDVSKLQGLCQFMFDPTVIKALQQQQGANNMGQPVITCALSAGPTGDAVPVNTTIDPQTCRITSTDTMLTEVTLTVTATTTVTTPPMQAIGLVTLYPVQGDQCCTLPPIAKTTMFTIQGLVLLLALNSEEQGGLLFFETANLNTPTLFATLDEAFTSPCDVPITLVSVSLAPTGASNEFCSLLSINQRGVGFFGEQQATIDALAQLFATVSQQQMSMIVCPISVTVRACNGLTDTATFLLRSTVYVTPPDES